MKVRRLTIAARHLKSKTNIVGSLGIPFLTKFGQKKLGFCLLISETKEINSHVKVGLCK